MKSLLYRYRYWRRVERLGRFSAAVMALAGEVRFRSLFKEPRQ